MNCPECEAEIDEDEDDLEVGDEVDCDFCCEVFEVTSLEPVVLESVEDDDGEEDDLMFDDDFEDDDEDEDDDGESLYARH